MVDDTTVAMWKGGHDTRTVAGRLGHTNAAMALRVYAHVLERSDQGGAGLGSYGGERSARDLRPSLPADRDFCHAGSAPSHRGD
ncbi:MAG: hypothetical protein NVS3B21_32810 [Acidimicrobiales bacterium]